MFIYPHWVVSSALWWQYLFPLGAMALAVGFGLMARWRRGPLAVFLFFAGTLFPAMGFFNVYPFVFSYVADHFQYLACLGIIVPLASGLTLACNHLKAALPWFAPAVFGTLLATLALLAHGQSGMYQDAVTLYRTTLKQNPACWLAHNNLGTVVGGAEAISHYEAALRLKPDFAEAQVNLGAALSNIPGRLPEAISHYETALRIAPDYAEAHNNLGTALSNIPGRLPEAISHYKAALRIKPDYAEAHNNLGIALSGMPGRLPEAITHFEAALQIKPDYAEAHNNLGIALSGMPGRRSEAIAHLEMALQLKPDLQPAHRMLLRLQTPRQ
jgi:tetratricopeptide (TPR) repeat protein